MGSPVLQGQHPHFQMNQVRKRAQSQIRRGSAASAWGAGEMVGAAPPLPTRSPGQISRYMLDGHPRSPLVWELGQRGGSKAKRILKSPSQGDNSREVRKVISPRQSSLTHTLLPTTY